MAENKNMPAREAFPIGDFNIGLVGITTAVYPFSIREALSTLADWFPELGRLQPLWKRAAASDSIAPRQAVASHVSGGLNG